MPCLAMGPAELSSPVGCPGLSLLPSPDASRLGMLPAALLLDGIGMDSGCQALLSQPKGPGLQQDSSPNHIVMHAGCSGRNGICLIPGLGQISEQHSKDLWTHKILVFPCFGWKLYGNCNGNCMGSVILQQIIDVLQAAFFLSISMLLTARITFPKEKKKTNPFWSWLFTTFSFSTQQ